MAFHGRLGEAAFRIVEDMSTELRSSVELSARGLERHFSPQPSMERANVLFFSRQQEPEESLIQFECVLRRLARRAFPRVEEPAVEMLVLDRLVAGTRHWQLKQHFAVWPPKSSSEVLQVAERLLLGPEVEDRRVSFADTRSSTAGGRFRQPEVTTRRERTSSPSRLVGAGRREEPRGRSPVGQHEDGVRNWRSNERGSGWNPAGGRGTCFFCQSPGHFKRECPYRPLNG